MIVVKLGGSLYNAPELRIWIQILADYSSLTILIVPGGGPFADQVRAAQKEHHFDDDIAHHMALLAMKQFGLTLTGLDVRCLPFDPHGPIKSLSVWLPDDTLLAETDLPHSWDLTSDSLALWISAKLRAEQLLLVKQINVKTSSIQKLTEDNVIDPQFSSLFSQHPIQTQIIHSKSYQRFANVVSQHNPKTKLYLP